MAQAELTEQNVIEAGIAASMAAHPELLPEPSVYFQDFNFGGTAFDANKGFSDSPSVGSVAGIADVDQRIAEIERVRGNRAVDLALDVQDVIDAGEAAREAAQAVTYSDGQFHMFGMDIDVEDMDAVVDETLENIDEVAERHNLSAQEKAELQTLLIAYRNADTPEEKAEILSEIADKQPEVAREMADEALIRKSNDPSRSLTQEESQNADVAQTVDQQEFLTNRQDTLEDRSLAEENLALRSGMSTASSSIGNSFESAYSPSEEFNAQAAGIQIAETAVPSAEPNTPSQVINAVPG